MSPNPGSDPTPAWGSFRDPDGRVSLGLDGPVHRHLTPKGLARAQAISGLNTIQSLQARRQWVAAESAEAPASGLVHPRVFFPSYPHEWPAAMVHRAARLTLEANQALTGEGWELKDATPTNILFEGPRPVFVDYLSPIQREASGLGWRAYGQFARTFLIPLLLHRKYGVPLRWMFLAHRDGISPEQALPLLGSLRRFHPAAFGLVTLPVWMGRRSAPAESARNRAETAPEIATAVTRRILKGLSRRLARLAPPPPGPSTWSDYQDLGISYTAEGLAAKEAFVAEALRICHPGTVLDLGCNTGKFSRMAAQAGARVVALDADPACVERIFLEAEAEGLDIQPLVADLGRPAPRLGWNYMEELSLLDRLQNRFDLTLALALVHHLLIRERVPMEGVVAFIARTTKRFAVIEWVGPEDPQFKRLAGPNGALYEHHNPDLFERCLSGSFRVVAAQPLPGSTRVIYLLERLASTPNGE